MGDAKMRPVALSSEPWNQNWRSPKYRERFTLSAFRGSWVIIIELTEFSLHMERARVEWKHFDNLWLSVNKYLVWDFLVLRAAESQFGNFQKLGLIFLNFQPSRSILQIDYRLKYDPFAAPCQNFSRCCVTHSKNEQEEKEHWNDEREIAEIKREEETERPCGRNLKMGSKEVKNCLKRRLRQELKKEVVPSKGFFIFMSAFL